MTLKGRRLLGGVHPTALLCLILGVCLLLVAVPANAGAGPVHSVARQWNDALLDAIRIDTARPPVHARNLFHVSAAMWDAWAAYDTVADTYLHHERAFAPTPQFAREKAISYAAYRILSNRFATSPGHVASQANFDALMASLGYDINITTTVGSSAAALGNRIAATYLAFGMTDGSNQAGNYAALPAYAPVNPPLVVGLPGNPDIIDVNRWQPLAIDFFIDQSGIVLGPYPAFVCPHWGHVKPFALTDADEGPEFVYHDPGPPPILGGVGDAEYKNGFAELIRYSAALDPTDGVMQDIGPGAYGYNTLGTDDGTGHPLNPVTGLPYAPNVVKRGDFTRIFAEFWADGPHSETPPGHWNTLANDVTDSPGFVRQVGGVGPILDPLAWDVFMYFALGGSEHDAAIATWGIKGYYDGIRPISAIRLMADRGQSSDPLQPSFHPDGITLDPGFIEVITPASSAPGERHEHLAPFVGFIAVYAWQGNPDDPDTEIGGVGWILGATWVPYQLPTFVTPPFAGYTSGHSCYSRTGAEVMTALTGSEFMPGGYYEYFFPQNGYLTFELGPSEDIHLPFATYYDAADQASISRWYGGIHPDFDDYPSRINGSIIGVAAFNHANDYRTGAIPDVPHLKKPL